MSRVYLISLHLPPHDEAGSDAPLHMWTGHFYHDASDEPGELAYRQPGDFFGGSFKILHSMWLQLFFSLERPEPRAIHKAIKLIFRYLKNSKDYGILFPTIPDQTEIDVSTFADSNWANGKLSRKSRSGYLVTINKAAVTWASKRQNIIALSTCETEYIAFLLGRRHSLSSDVMGRPSLLK